MATTPKIIVVGGGLAGLAATIKIAEAGGHVDLFSIRSSAHIPYALRGESTRPKISKAKATPPGNTLTTPSTAATFSLTSLR
jgi:monoamine oxidase